MSAFPEVVGWVNATSPFAGSNATPWIKFSVAAVSRREAIPNRLYEEDTNIREIPSGVGNGSGEQYKEVEASTVITSFECMRAVGG